MDTNILKKEVIKHLRNISTSATSIVEIGFGRGVFSQILKEAFPDSYLIGYDKNPSKNFTGRYLDEARYSDILKSKDSFSLISMGSLSESCFGWNFGIRDKAGLSGLVDAIDGSLDHNGVFFLFTSVQRVLTKPQKNLMDTMSFMQGNGRELFSDVLGDEGQFLSELFQNKGLYTISIDFVKNPRQVSDLYLCRDWLRSINSDIECDLSLASQLDESSLSTGQDSGYFMFFKALKA
jgi:hypothetical protein